MSSTSFLPRKRENEGRAIIIRKGFKSHLFVNPSILGIIRLLDDNTDPSQIGILLFYLISCPPSTYSTSPEVPFSKCCVHLSIMPGRTVLYYCLIGRLVDGV